MKTLALVRASLLPALCLAVSGVTLRATISTGLPPVAAPADAAWDSLKLTWDKGEETDSFLGNPIGNSHIGAKIKGGVETEVLQLNNKTFWSSWPLDETDPARRDALVATRAKLAADDIPGADIAARGMWGPNNTATYLPLGNLLVRFDHGPAATNYRRELDINRAVSTVRYTVGDVTYTREAFATFPDRVIVMRVSADKPGRLAFTARLACPPEMGAHGSVATDGPDTLVMRGRAPAMDLKTWDAKKGMIHETRVRLLPSGGRVAPGREPGSLRVENADSVVFLIADETSYNGFDKEPGTEGVDPAPLVRADIARASAKKYADLLAAHVRDYQALFHRVWVDIDDRRPLPQVLGFQYARYDMIAVSRSGDRPHNQQGMWSYKWRPHSNCNHFLNENVEKYYNLIEAANLAETGAPLWNWMDELAVNGRRTARVDWGFKGWFAPHCSDIWATTPLRGGNNEWAVWPMGGAWLCQILWDHYAFGRDRTFLRDRAYPLLKGAAEFALDYLVEDKDGTLVTSPSTSPENRFALADGGAAYAVTVGSTIDMALIRELFQNTVEACRVLAVDPDFSARLEAALPRLKPFQISRRPSSKGELQEWARDYSRLPDDPRHRFTPQRHASHLIAVWPLRQITAYQTPELFAAARLALQNRGSGGYHPDKGAMWARLKEGDRAITANDSFPTGPDKLVGQWPGKYAGFAELLVQSQAGEIELLPALPAAWKSGHVFGLRARGGYTLSLEWQNGKLVRCQIDSLTGATPVVRYEGKLLDLANDSRVTLNLL